MRETLTVYRRNYLNEIRAAKARSLEAIFDQQVLAEGIEGVVPEFLFHPTRKWRLDRAIPEIKVGAEMVGGLWLGRFGGHSSATGIQRDIEKNNELQELGWLCAYITKDMLKDGSGIELFKRLIKMRER